MQVTTMLNTSCKIITVGFKSKPKNKALLIQEVILYKLSAWILQRDTWPSVWFSWRTFLILREASVVFWIEGALAVDFSFYRYTGILIHIVAGWQQLYQYDL